VQLFELAVKNNSITSADIEAIIDEEEKANEEDNNDNNDFNNVNEEDIAAAAVVAVDTNSESNSDSDDDDSPTSPTTRTAEEPKVGHDLRSIEEKEEDNVIIDDIVMQCPVCTANPIGTNLQNCDVENNKDNANTSSIQAIVATILEE